ncbi:FecR family protein [Alkalitalea saponilacus]|nr:FecR domain-containing protein [Alkalitalea saponilacus]
MYYNRMTSNINNQEELIVRYLCGDTSPEEIITIESLLENDREFIQLFNETRFVWEQAAKPCYNPEQDWQAIRRRIGFTKKKSGALSFFMRVAAVIGLVISVSAGLWVYWNVPGYGRWVVFETGASSDSIVLPDQSIVFLNRNSSLKFLNSFKPDQRTVALTGEGYFEIQQDKDRPFKVETGIVQVHVTGTAFHLDATHENGIIELNVTKGGVTIYSPTGSLDVKQGERALAGQRLIQKSLISDNNFLSWKTGLLEFDNATLYEIAKTLKDHFPEIEAFNIKDTTNIKVTTRFQKQSLHDITEELSLHFQKKFALHNGVLVISD